MQAKMDSLRKNKSQGTVQFGGTMRNFNSTISSNKSIGRLIPNSALHTQNYNAIPSNDIHHLTITGDYDTYMMSSNNVSLKQMSRTASQGKINVTNDFDVRTLLLPDISQSSRLKIDKSNISRFIIDKQSFLDK
jgi:hypothetical protein